MHRSSPGISRYSPGKSPRDNTDESLSSSSGSGVLRIRPTTSSRTSFQRSSWACSNNPRQGRSSLWSTTEGTYSPLGASSQISNQTRTSYFA
ncbi:GSCOCG00013020001-RA-CDS [Cotesia congregata]|nr:GSCOCG00013020001-RA-CDS [Cotesia congregata]